MTPAEYAAAVRREDMIHDANRRGHAEDRRLRAAKARGAAVVYVPGGDGEESWAWEIVPRDGGEEERADGQ